MKTINIRIPRVGISTGAAQIEIETDGYKGASCKNATKIFLEALAATTVSDVETQDMHEVESGVEWTQEGGGGDE